MCRRPAENWIREKFLDKNGSYNYDDVDRVRFP